MMALLIQNRMGNQIGNIMLGSRSQENKMLACLKLMNKIFVSQIVTLAVEGVLIGYYVVNAFLIVKKQFEQEEIISPLCSICNTNNFQLICKRCKEVVSCEDCFIKKKVVCPECKNALKNEDLIKIYMN